MRFVLALFFVLITGAAQAADARHYAPFRSEASLTLTNVGGATDSPVNPCATTSPYTGPGDCVSGATVFYGLRAYSAAAASAGMSIANVCTALDAACGDFIALASGKISIECSEGLSGSCASLQSAAAISGSLTIKEWYDQSGNGNNATQATIANRATYSASCTSGHSMPCAQFASASTQNYVSANTITQAQPYSDAIYAITSTVANQGFIATKANGFAVMSHTSSASTWRVNVALTATAADGTWHSGQGVFNGVSNSKIVIDGTVASGSGGTNNISGELLCIGSNGNGNCGFQPLNGSMSEVGFWPVGFTTAQLANLAANDAGWW